MEYISIKLCALLILLSTLICASVSCSGGDNSSDDPADTTASADTASEETTDAAVTYEEAEIPESSFDGEEFRILYPNWSLYNSYYEAFADVR